ncbi:hypothetical protein QTP86_027797 [Hemibagrus guttatus]|nr:hypothetical protein QTP86_027797 [Hemibagrus guttatus]
MGDVEWRMWGVGYGRCGLWEMWDGASLGIKAGYTLDRVPTHRSAHTHSHSLTTDNLETPINLQCMSLDRGRKPEHPEETPEAQGEHANSTHTHGGGGNQTPNPGGVRQTC